MDGIYDLLLQQLAMCINYSVSFVLQISKKIKRTPGGVDGAEILGKATDMYMTKTNKQAKNIKVKNDHRSKFSNLSNWNEKPEKIKASTGLENLLR